MSSPEDKIQPEAERIHRAYRGRLRLKDETLTRFLIDHPVEKEVGLVQRLARKKDLRDEPVHPTRAKDGKVDVRRTPPPIRLHHRVGARLDREKLEPAFCIGR